MNDTTTDLTYSAALASAKQEADFHGRAWYVVQRPAGDLRLRDSEKKFPNGWRLVQVVWPQKQKGDEL